MLAPASRLPVAPSTSPERRVDVVVNTGRSYLAALAPSVDSDPGLGRQLGLAPPHHVVLQRARASVVDHCAVLQRDAAAVREQPLVEGAQPVEIFVDVLAARGFAGIAVGFKRGDDPVDVAGRECTLVRGDDIRPRVAEGLAAAGAGGAGDCR
jgi:hypothetical protein